MSHLIRSGHRCPWTFVTTKERMCCQPSKALFTSFLKNPMSQPKEHTLDESAYPTLRIEGMNVIPTWSQNELEIRIPDVKDVGTGFSPLTGNPMVEP